MFLNSDRSDLGLTWRPSSVFGQNGIGIARWAQRGRREYGLYLVKQHPIQFDPNMRWDVFICHAHEDKAFVRELANALATAGIRVWYDEFALRVGDNLRQSIDRGLAGSRFGIVILSHAFFQKRWTQYELNGLVEKDLERKVILPIWHGIERQEIMKFSPSLADKVAVKSSNPLTQIVVALGAAMNPSAETDAMGTLEDPGVLKKPRLDLLRDLPVDSPAEQEDK